MSPRVYLPSTVARMAPVWPVFAAESVAYGVEPRLRGTGGDAEEEYEYQAMLSAAAHAAAWEIGEPGGRVVVAVDVDEADLQRRDEEPGEGVAGFTLSQAPARSRVAAVFLDDEESLSGLPTDAEARLEGLLDSPMLWFEPGEIDARFVSGR